MTTTDQIAQNEAKKAAIKEASIKHIIDYIDNINNMIPLEKLNVYELTYAPDVYASIMANICVRNLDVVKSTVYQKLSKRRRIKLKGEFDGWCKFKPVLYPGEKITSATLYLALTVPKDPNKYQQWLDGTIDDSGWFYNEDHVSYEYIPIKSVIPNEDGSFEFFNKPFWHHPFYSYSVEVFYESSKMLEKTIGVEMLYVSMENKNQISEIQAKYYESFLETVGKCPRSNNLS